MIVLEGKSVNEGIAFGKIYFSRPNQQLIQNSKIDDIASEIIRFRQAKDKASFELEQLYKKVLLEVGEKDAQIFQIHQMMLEDDDYCDAVENFIRTRTVNAEYAVSEASEEFSKMFLRMENEYMQGRASDIKDVSQRLVYVLSGDRRQEIMSDVPVILAAVDLTPSETVQLDKSAVFAFATVNGSANSHTAILARALDIPAIVGIGKQLTAEYDGMDAIIDGFNGRLYIQPDSETSRKMKLRFDEEAANKILIEQLKGKENITQDGRKIDIFANIGSPNDLQKVLDNDAGGIGLFRSEFIYMESKNYPTESEQFIAYKAVAEGMGDKTVVIRTLDIGADKKVDYFELPHEENPAMGYRAIRICLTCTDVFKTQLRALYRASVFGKIAIMFPMITSIEEIRKIKEIVNEVKQELEEEKLAFSDFVQLGIMIETPAAAIISDILAKEVDFFSIGTNDLTQYVLAIDRQNQNLDAFYNPHHPAVLRLISQVVDNAHKNGIWVGICGELGADPELTETFLSLGVDELSVSPSAVLKLRQTVRQINLSD